MTLEYTLTEDDHLTYQLYVDSRSERIRKKRKKARYRLPAIFLIATVVALLTERYLLSAIYVGFSVVYFSCWHWYERRHHVKHYRSFVKENYTGKVASTKLHLGPDVINADNENGSSTINYSAIDEMAELPQHILLRMGPGGIIIPKTALINPTADIETIKDLAKAHNVKYVDDNNWVWK